MVGAGSIYSVDRQRTQQRRFHLVGAAGLILYALACGLILASGISEKMPLLMLVAFVTIVAAVAVWRWPVVAVYVEVFGALLFDQWPIEGLDPITIKTHFFQSLSGFTPVPLPASPAEILLGFALAAVVLPAMVRRGVRFKRGALFGPVIFFTIAVVGSFAYGFAVGPSGTQFNINASWVEARSFVSLVLCYFLACNLITTRKRLMTLIWIIIAGVGIKGVQGIQNYITEQRLGLHLPAITGHEDVIFFSTFFLLLIALKLYGHNPRQEKAMLWFLLPVAFTDLATGRRIAFLILPIAFFILGMSLWKTRRKLFMRVVPVVVVVMIVYTAIFWNHPGSLLGEPVRAFRSQIGQASTRDELSDAWRDLERQNIADNIKSAPLTGLGFGRPYKFYVAEPSLDSTGFIYWDYITHNAIFWVWMKMGMIGFIAFWFLIGSAMVQGLVIFRRTSDGYLRAIALVAVATTAMQVYFSYGDLGLTYARPMIFLGCLIGVLGGLPRIIAQESEQNTSEMESRNQLSIQGAGQA